MGKKKAERVAEKPTFLKKRGLEKSQNSRRRKMKPEKVTHPLKRNNMGEEGSENIHATKTMPRLKTMCMARRESSRVCVFVKER